MDSNHWPDTCIIGREMTRTAPGAPALRPALFTPFWNSEPWVCSTPLGLPVVPEV